MDSNNIWRSYDALKTIYGPQSSGTSLLLRAHRTSLLTEKNTILVTRVEHYNSVLNRPSFINVQAIVRYLKRRSTIPCQSQPKNQIFRKWSIPFPMERYVDQISSLLKSSRKEGQSYFQVHQAFTIHLAVGGHFSKTQRCLHCLSLQEKREQAIMRQSPRDFTASHHWQDPCKSPPQPLYSAFGREPPVCSHVCP